MAEILTFQIGGCGNSIATRFWDILCFEHCINPRSGNCEAEEDLPYERLNGFFDELSSGKYAPRAVACDLDQQGLNIVRDSYHSQLYTPANFVYGHSGSTNNWAKGHNLGVELLDSIMDCARRQTQKCESLSGMQVIHSIGGGTGSGMGSLLVQKLKDAYPGTMLQSLAVLPSNKINDQPMEAYNTVLALSSIGEHSDYCLPIDNEALHDICTKTLKLPTPVKGDLNHIVAEAMSGVTCTFRTPSKVNGTMRRLVCNLVPFPRLKLLTVCFAPIQARGDCYLSPTVPEATRRVFDAKNALIGADVRRGRYLALTVVYRGNVDASQRENTLYSPGGHNSSYFVEWIPNNLVTGVCQLQQYQHKMAATLVGNSTAIQIVLRRVENDYLKMLHKKPYIHLFQSQGMEETEIAQAGQRLLETVEEYQQYQEFTLDEEDQYWDEQEG